MLRFVENGFKVKMVKVEDEGYSVDTPDDLVIVENILRKKLC
jgi:CMP-2-keto-3-deoxyoctulosonic acid synthetase